MILTKQYLANAENLYERFIRVAFIIM